MRSVLRQDPDVLIGELRDIETIENALTVAEQSLNLPDIAYIRLCPNITVLLTFSQPQQQQVRTAFLCITSSILSTTYY